MPGTLRPTAQLLSMDRNFNREINKDRKLIRNLVNLISCLLLVTSLTSATLAQDSSLVNLAEKSDWKSVATLIESGKEINQAQPDGMTTLHWAVFHQHHATIKRLLKSDADVDALTVYQVSPLSLACEFADVKIVESLLEAGADLESKRMGGERPLMIASRRGELSIVNQLVDRGAELDAKETGGQTALMWASANGHVEVVERLVKAGADKNLKTWSGFTAMFFAARQGKTDVVMSLLDAGVDVNSIMEPKNSGGRRPRKRTSALLLAVESGHYELALKLVECGADPNDQRSGYAPLHAVSWVRKTKRGDDPDGDPPPRGSGKLTSSQFVRQLIAAGADVNLALAEGKAKGKAKLNHKNGTPFLFAASTADLPLMKLLIELGADPTINNADGCTPLMAATGVGVVAVGEEPGTEEEVNLAIEYLIGLGIDPNVVDDNGETAMHGAAYRNFPGAVTVLASLGADPNVWNNKNKHNWTPHKIAEGYRPGSFKPSPATTAALDEALKVKIQN